MCWRWVDLVGEVCVDVGVVFVLFAGWIVLDVEELVVEVIGVSDAVFVVAAVPDCSGDGFAGCEGVAAFDELNAFCCGLIDGWSDKDVNVVGHYYEAVELEAAFVAVLEEGVDEEFCVGCALEVAMLLEDRDRDGVGAQLLSYRSHEREHTPGAKAPFPLCCERGPSLKAWRT
jgi:hypothetical protein